MFLVFSSWVLCFIAQLIRIAGVKNCLGRENKAEMSDNLGEHLQEEMRQSCQN